MTNPKVGKYTGPGTVDVQDIKTDLVDVKDGDLHGYMREKPDFDRVWEELACAMPTHGDAAGIHPSIYAGFVTKTEVLAKIRDRKIVIGKLYEILCESEVYYEDARESDLIRLAKIILDTAHHNDQPDLLAVFDKTLAYRSQYGDKAAATRRKNEKAKAEPEPEQGKPGEAQPIKKPS